MQTNQTPQPVTHPLLAEILLSLSQAARRVPPYRGKRTNPSTIFRWIRDGVKLPDGRVLKLDGLRLAGRWLTSVEAIDRFLTSQNAACHPDPDASRTKPIRTPGQRRRASEAAERRLEKMGIGCLSESTGKAFSSADIDSAGAVGKQVRRTGNRIE